MARAKKLQAVREVKDPDTGRTATLFFDPNMLDFYGQVGDQEFRSKEGQEVQQWLYEHLASDTTLEWIPVIYATGNHNRSGKSQHEKTNGSFAGFEIDRFYLAKNFDGEVVKSEWDVVWNKARVTETERPSDNILRTRSAKGFMQAGTKFPVLPMYIKGRKSTYEYRSYTTLSVILPYSDEMWDGFNRLLDQVEALGVRFDQMLRDQETLNRIHEIGAGLAQLALPSGNKDDHQ